jgi:hypothetical protein
MLTHFDWLRRARTGAELLATLNRLKQSPELLDRPQGPPLSALDGPCERCGFYARLPKRTHCPWCQAVLDRAKSLGQTSRQTALVWGYVNRLPQQLAENEGFYATTSVRGSYVHDSRRFLLALNRRDVQSWLQELVLYHGPDLKGLLQIIPTMGGGHPDFNMGDALVQVIQREANFSLDQLRVQFYQAPYQLRRMRERDKQGRLTFEVVEFLRLLEMALVFRVVLRPDEQQALYELLHLKETGEELFYWGRFLGLISQEAKDMLNAWKIRQWPLPQVELLYELLTYVDFFAAD